MAQILGELSYNNKTLKPIGRPVDDLKALYKDKQISYMTATDNYANSKTVLNNIQTTGNAKDEAVLREAKTFYNDTMTVADEEGDFENKVMDSKRLANDLANKYGLLKVQENATTRQAHLASLKDRLDKGKITRQDYQDAIRDSDRNYKGIERDEVSGEYVGNYIPTQVQDYVDAGGEVAKALEGFKANTITLKDKQGRELYPQGDGSTGYYENGTLKTVTEAELVQAAKAYIKSNPAIQGQFQQRTYFDLQNLLHDEEGNKRELNTNDIRNLVNNSNSIELMEKLGIKNANDLNNLDTILEGKDLEQVYKAIKDDQLVNDAMALGVAKESFEEYSKSYLKDWKLEENIKAANKSAKDMFVETGTLHSYYTQDNVTSDDIEKTSEIYTKGIEEIAELETSIATMEKNEAFSPDIDRKRAQLEAAKRTVSIINQRMESIIKTTPAITAAVRGSFIPLDRNKFNYSNEKGKENPKVSSSISINEGALNRLLFKSVASPVTPEEVKEYVKLDRGVVYAEASREALTQDDINLLIQQHPEFATKKKVATLLGGEQERTTIDYNRLNKYVYDTLKEEGQSGMDKLNISQATRHKIGGIYHNNFEKAKQRFASKVNEAAKDLKEKAASSNISYTKQFKTFNLPDLTPAEARANPIHQLNYLLGNVTGEGNNTPLDSNYFTQLKTSLDNLDIATHIEQEFKVKDTKGEILWNKGKLQSSIDVMPDINTGVYSPVVIMQVPIIKDDKEVTIQVPVNYLEPSYVEKYKEALKSQHESLLNLKKTKGLTGSQEQLLDRINTNLYNISGTNAREFDLLNLYNAKHKEVIPFELWDGHTSDIQVFQQDSPTNLSYYLTEMDKGVRKYWAINERGGQELVTEKQLKADKKLKALGANTPEDLKTLYSNLVFNSGLGNKKEEDFRVAIKDTVDVTSIFGMDIKENANVIPRVAKEYEPKVLAMKFLFPNLVLTDALRTTDSETGAANSYHKYGKALDFKLTNESRKLIALSETEKQRLGIKSVGVHNGNHVHLEFN